jgi:transcriptional regulator with PAS, ATPase and Fis domain
MTTTTANRTSNSSRTSRRRDRREAMAALLGSLTRALDGQAHGSRLRSTFEEALLSVIPVRSVRLLSSTQRPAGGAEPPPGTLAFDVPASDPSRTGLLEATIDPDAPPDEWELQTLAMSAHVGALVLGIEQGRGEFRAGAFGLARSRRDSAAALIGSTSAMHALRSVIERVARTDFTVLLEGESGVGKELVARQVHELSERRGGPFVAINCAALVDTLLEAELFGIEERTATGVRGRRGKFEVADGGTLFLDEVSDLSLSAQAKLLRAIQDFAVERVGGHGLHRVDIRIIAATNRALPGLVERRLFRKDLYYRLSGVDIRVPALRERRDDILQLTRYFLERHRSIRPLRLSPAAAEALLTYDWPGNVRELERFIEGAVALARSEVIEAEDLPAVVRGDRAVAMAPSLERNETLRAWGSRYARLMVERCQGNKRKACQALGISYHTLQAYLRYPLQGAEAAREGEWAGAGPEPTISVRRPGTSEVVARS